MEREDEEVKYCLLFRAVIRQAARDAFLKAHPYWRDRARVFLSGGADLDFVCDIAYVDAAKIKRLMKSLSADDKQNFKRFVRLLKK